MSNYCSLFFINWLVHTHRAETARLTARLTDNSRTVSRQHGTSFHVTLLKPRDWKRLRDLWKMCGILPVSQSVTEKNQAWNVKHHMHSHKLRTCEKHWHARSNKSFKCILNLVSDEGRWSCDRKLGGMRGGGVVPEPVRTQWRRHKFLPRLGIESVVQPIANCFTCVCCRQSSLIQN
jgi:hypothetical protein